MWTLLAPSLLLSVVLLRQAAWAYEEREDVFELRMPEIVPTQSDSYLCYPFAIPDDETWYITSVGPIVDPALVHHVIVVTCSSPASNSTLWSCGGTRDKTYPDAFTCNDRNSELLYDWTTGVDPYRFPKGVGFQAGGDPMRRYFVLQVHYNNASVFNETNRDSTGLKITYTRQRVSKVAGLHTFGAGANVVMQPRQFDIIEDGCRVVLPNDSKVHVFSYLVHTHDLGLFVAIYRQRDGNWTELGRRSPQLPKAFTPADMQVRNGDLLLVRCTMYNFRESAVPTGFTHHDEMCFMRLMFYAEGAERPPKMTCTPMSHKELGLLPVAPPVPAKFPPAATPPAGSWRPPPGDA